MVRAASFGGTAWRPAMWAAIAALLLLPLVAMQFTRELAWTGFDFAAAAVLLGGLGLGLEIVSRTVRGTRRRVALGGAILLLVALVAAEGAVGIFH